MKRTKYCKMLALICLALAITACVLDISKTSEPNKIQNMNSLTKLETERNTFNISVLEENYDAIKNKISEYSINEDQYELDFIKLSSTDILEYVPKDDKLVDKSIEADSILIDNEIFTYPISSVMDGYMTYAAIINENAESRLLEVKILNSTEINSKITDLEPAKKTNMIYEVVYGNNFIYWVEASTDYNKSIDTWSIYSMDLTTRKYIQIADSSDYIKSTLLPRLGVEKDMLVYTVGCSQNNMLSHFIYLFDSSLNKKSQVFKINNVINPYTIPRINDGIISYPDYLDGNWYMLFYNTADNKIYTLKLSFAVKSEHPRFFIVRNKYLAYISSLNILRLINMETDKEFIIDDDAHTVGILENKLIYSGRGHLYCYDEMNNLVSSLDEDEDCFYGYFTQNNKSISIIREKEKKYQIYLISNKPVTIK